MREEAALICAIAASQPGMSYREIGEHLEASIESIDLANRAYWFAYGESWIYFGDSSLDAEAESLIRTGWAPND